MVNEEDCLGEEVLADDSDTIGDLIGKLFIEDIASILTSKEKWLFKQLIIDRDFKSFRALSEEFNIPRSTLYDWKKKLFDKIKNNL